MYTSRKNIVVGTKGWIKFPVFKGSKFKRVFDREVEIFVECMKESYGSEKKHWFTFKILKSNDTEFPEGSTKRFQGKNAYRYITIEEQPDDVVFKTDTKNIRRTWESLSKKVLTEVQLVKEV